MNKKAKKIQGRHAFASSMMFSALSGVLSSIPAYARTPQALPAICNPCTNLNSTASGSLNFVGSGSATAAYVGNALNITQSTPKAILNWKSFDIQNGNTVNFFQPSTTSETLNRIWDLNGASIIQGALNANGQVYLINQNGIIFGKGAQINVNTLIASSLDIKDDLFKAGYLTSNNSAITPAFVGTGGFIRIDSGATINGTQVMMFAPVVENSGKITSADGQVVLAAGHNIYLEASQDPNLRGVLVEVDANGQNVVAMPDATGAVHNVAEGTVTNTSLGNILSQRGNTTLIGYAVNQEGMISATTSVTENGSIKLLARYNVDTSGDTTYTIPNTTPAVTVNDIRAQNTGDVTLAKGSQTLVLPEATDSSTTTGTKGNPSIIEVMGKTVDVAGSITAPGGNVNLIATANIVTGEGVNNIYQDTNISSFVNPDYKPASTNDGLSSVLLENGSLIDVSGSTASVSVARNILAVQLRGTELANSPLQRNGILYGQTVYIDIAKGTPIADYSGAEAQIARGVLERTATGGNVVIKSSGSVVTNPNSTINISGGQVDYSGALVNSTTLMSNGVAYNIANASPNLVYDGILGRVIVNHAKWGVSDTYYTMSGNSKVWDPGYVQGMNAGSVAIAAPDATIKGRVIAKTVSGINQRQPYVDPDVDTDVYTNVDTDVDPATPYANTWQMLPNGGTFTLGYNGSGTQQTVPNTSTTYNDYVTSSDVVVGSSPSAPAANTIYLDPTLFSQGLNNLAIYTNGSAGIAAGTTLNLAPGGSVNLTGGQVNVAGSINAQGGSVNLASNTVLNTSYNINNPNSFLYSLPGAVAVNGNITTRGVWINDAAVNSDRSAPVVLNGGNIAVISGGNLNIASGVILDASGGAWVNQSGKIQGGNGGNISLSAGATITAPLDGSAFKSYGVNTGKGGKLSIATGGDVQIGSAPGGTQLNSPLSLSAAFFQKGGFSSYSINGQNVNVDGLINPKSQSLVLGPNAALQASGNEIYDFSTVGFLPDSQRNPTSITLSGFDLHIGSSSSSPVPCVGACAEILVDPAASITLKATDQLDVYGILDAPAGTISLTLKDSSTLFNDASSIWLGADSQLLAQGYFQQSQTSNGLVQGQVLSGGSINIKSNGGYFASESNSVMDVSGTSANIDLPAVSSGHLIYQKTHVAGDAGSISVTAPSVFFDGKMYGGVESGSQAAAGNFSLNLYNDGSVYTGNPSQLNLKASGNGTFLAAIGLSKSGDSLLENPGYQGSALLDQHSLANFDQVTLRSYGDGGNQMPLASIVLDNNVSLAARRSITLDAPIISVAGNTALTSAHVTLENSDINNQAVAAAPFTPLAPGNNTLTVNGSQLIDLTGNFTVTGANNINLDSSSGDIRMNGVLDSRMKDVNGNYAVTSLTGSLSTMGDVAFTANQVYTSTLAQYTVAVMDASGIAAGKITVNNNGGTPVSTPVLSAGGSLTLSALEVDQNGVLKAPLGTINIGVYDNVNGSFVAESSPGNIVNLNANSITSVSAQGQAIPFGYIQGGTNWYYDLTGQGVLQDIVQIIPPALATATAPASHGNIPQKILNLTGPNINIHSGAVVDLSGGGNLYASEFLPGTGGTVNVLNPTVALANTFAIVPGISGFAPYDPQSVGAYTGSKTVLQDGAMVYLAGGKGLKAGYYSLLPASYALLPGAYRVTAISGHQDMQPGVVSLQTDGTMIMAGKLAVAGTGIQNARWSGFAVSSGAIVRTQSQYNDSYANTFFAGTGARLPMDAGQLVLNATGNNAQLALNGTFNAQAAIGGQGTWVDINGSNFDIVNTTPAITDTGAVVLTASMLNNLNAGSLLIGGTRKTTPDGMSIAVGAGTVRVENGDNGGTSLSGPEIILAANNAVAIDAGSKSGDTGSSIVGSGTYTGTPQNITIGYIDPKNSGNNISGNGALLRVSSGAQVTVSRINTDGTTGVMTVGSKTALGKQPTISGNSVLLDATNQTHIDGGVNLAGKAFSVSASAIDIGTGSSSFNSLALTPALLLQMQNFQDIALHSYGDINFYGATGLGGMDTGGKYQISNLTLNAVSLNGINTGETTTVDAGTVTLMNNNTGTPSSNTTGSGTLNVNANTIVLADGNKTMQGFDMVNLNAAQQIKGQGTGTLAVTSTSGNGQALNLQGTLTGDAKSDQQILATQYDIAIKPATTTPVYNTDVGAKLAITGRNILDQGNINLLSGNLSLHATTGDVTLYSTSTTSAAGSAKTIAGQTVYAPAGAINLISDSGNVTVNGSVDVSGAVDANDATRGGDAGSLNISAAHGIASIATGTLKGRAVQGKKQGSFTLDANSISGTLTALNNMLMPVAGDTTHLGGFNQLINIRVRSGDLQLDTGSTVTAQSYQLAADNGKIDVYGTIDASATTNGTTNGGSILLAAGGDVNLNSKLDASATTGAGGTITLETKNDKIDLNNGTYMDVSGATPGTVHMRAPQISNGTDIAINNAATSPVSAGANVIVEGFNTYQRTNISSTDTAVNSTLFNDAKKFAGNGANIKARLGIAGAQVLPGIQINSTSDLTLSSNWDLHSWRFDDGSGTNTVVPGILTLQAAGNLQFGSGTTIASLSDGFTTATSFTLSNSPSWSYNLVAGADATAANVMAVNNAGSGNVNLVAGSEKTTKSGVNIKTQYTFEMVRTGTGDINIAAGDSLYLGNRDSTIYTAGVQSTLPANLFSAYAKTATAPTSANAYFPISGGSINIAVKNNISSVGQNGNGGAVNQLFSDWLWRQGSGTASASIPTAWWINFGTFAQNIGAFGGGNLNISAGGNITDLSAVVPSTGYVNGTQAIQQGKGNLTVTAGGNIDSGIFYVGNGQGNIQAGGSLDSLRTDTLTGVSLNTILALGQGNINVTAGGDLTVQAVLNPTMLTSYIYEPNQPLGSNGSSVPVPVFSTYGDNSRVSLGSLYGNVLFENDINSVFASSSTAAIPNNANSPYFLFRNANTVTGLLIAPSIFQATAIDGSISIGEKGTTNVVLLNASQSGNLQLMAATDINFNGDLTMSDATPQPFLSLQPLVSGQINISSQPAYIALDNIDGLLSGTLLPLHSQDTSPLIIAAGGSIYGSNTNGVSTPTLILPKSATVQAGLDILNLSMSVQNQNSSDITSLVAGRDIMYTTTALGIQNLDGSQGPAIPTDIPTAVTLAGPGQLVLEAGRNISLGQTSGLVTTGNISNPYLPSQGAAITVLTGLGGNVQDTQAFISKYINPSSANIYAPDLVSYIAANVDPASTTGKTNIPYLVNYLFDPSTGVGQTNTAALNTFVANNGGVNLTTQEAFTFLKSLPIATQQSFAYNYFKAQPTQAQAAYVASSAMQGNLPDLISFVNDHGGNQGVNVTNVTEAYSTFNAMPTALQDTFVNQVFFNELKLSGRSAINSGNYGAGYDAISTLFPATTYQGDLSLYYSQIKTEQGGSINILTPGGGVNAGLANPPTDVPTKTAAELGVVTVGGGDVNAYVNNDFAVNQSRVFTLQGGNILMWSNNGNLDAGKGSKSVSATPPPRLVVDPVTGLFTLDATQSVAGSGIRVLLANPNTVAGSVDLYAPKGVINAGDAGIGSAGNINLGALHIVGADNINFGGAGQGVPVATSTGVGVGGLTNLQDASNVANQATQNLNNDNMSQMKNALSDFMPSIFSVDVIGLGGETYTP